MDIPQKTELTGAPIAGRHLASAAETGPHEPFAISAPASLHDARALILKHGDTFGVFDKNGDASSGPGGAEGIYHRDTRHLSHFSVTLDGARPLRLSSTLRDDNATLTCDLTNPDLFDASGRLDWSMTSFTCDVRDSCGTPSASSG